MSVTYTLNCDHPSDCPAQWVSSASTLRTARFEARLKEWQHRSQPAGDGKPMRVEDRCPRHHFPSASLARAAVYERVPESLCTYRDQVAHHCPSKDARTPQEKELWHWCGHDQLGHRMSRMFLRNGYGSVEAVTSLTRDQMLKMPGCGALALARWSSFIEQDAP